MSIFRPLFAESEKKFREHMRTVIGFNPGGRICIGQDGKAVNLAFWASGKGGGRTVALTSLPVFKHAQAGAARSRRKAQGRTDNKPIHLETRQLLKS